MRARWIGVGVCALVFGVALVLLRGTPVAGSDQGIVLSVAARMVDGDRLYSEVIENKDPLFFYAAATAFGIGGWRGPFVLDGIWLGLAGLSFALLLRELRAPRPAVVAGFFVYPLALTSGWYQAGLTMIAALAIAPLVALFWLRGRFATSGALLGAVMLFKLNLAPVAAGPLAAFVALGAPSGSRRRQVAWAAVGLAGALAVVAASLAAQGALRAYLDTISYNLHYANALLGSDSTFGRMAEHFEIVIDDFRLSGRWQLPAALLVLAVFAVAVYFAVTRYASRRRLLAATAVAAVIATLGTLALTAYWSHHLQMLAYPAAFVAATLISVVASSFGRRAGAVAAAVCVLFALWSSVKNEDRLDVSPAWTTTPHSGGAVALEDARKRFFAGSERVSYMVFGGNSENAHAAFIGEGFDLVCRWFHLYPVSLDEQFEETRECSEREDPMLILITLGFFDERAAPPAWKAFVADARHLLDAEYGLVETEHPGFQVFKRRAPVET
jgi:hypothetical protein